MEPVGNYHLAGKEIELTIFLFPQRDSFFRKNFLFR